jgi:hypothetical protein
VYEGVVVVRHAGEELRVGAGESWPARCASGGTVAAERGAPQSAARSPHDGAFAAVAGAAARSTPDSRRASTLTAQNDLFGLAVAAKQRGDAQAAIEHWGEFVTRYPASPLAESAAAQRMKLLHTVDPERAAVAARAYLARWPDGFARSFAEGIVAGPR